MEEMRKSGAMHWGRAAARRLALGLAPLGVTPNQVTTASLILSLVAAEILAGGERPMVVWGAGLFVFARFLDYVDGELARITGGSRWGHYLDWFTDTISYAVLFIAMGLGFIGILGPALVLLISGPAVCACFLNSIVGLLEEERNGIEPGFPRLGSVGIDEGIFLILPAYLFGVEFGFYVVCSLGATIYATLRLIAWRKSLAADAASTTLQSNAPEKGTGG